MNYVKQFWAYLDGKKTVIASLAGLGLSWAQATGKVSAETAVYLASALSVFTGVAVGHKVQKSKG